MMAQLTYRRNSPDARVLEALRKLGSSVFLELSACSGVAESEIPSIVNGFKEKGLVSSSNDKVEGQIVTVKPEAFSPKIIE